jgi:hypothetical protein
MRVVAGDRGGIDEIHGFLATGSTKPARPAEMGAGLAGV